MGGVDDGREEVVVGQAREAGHDGQVGAHRVQAGQGVDLEEGQPPVRVAAQVDPGGVPALQGLGHRQSQPGRLDGEGLAVDEAVL